MYTSLREVPYANNLVDGLPLFGMEWQGIHSKISTADRNSGAVLRGQEGNQVDNRVARCNYGVEYRSRCEKYSPDAVWCPYEEIWSQRHCMEWYITKVCADTPAVWTIGKLLACERICYWLDVRVTGNVFEHKWADLVWFLSYSSKGWYPH